MKVHYIGDVPGARGMALAGVKVHVPQPDPDTVWNAVEQSLLQADLILIEPALAAHVQERLSEQVLKRTRPPVVVLAAQPEPVTMPRTDLSVRTTVKRARDALGLFS